MLRGTGGMARVWTPVVAGENPHRVAMKKQLLRDHHARQERASKPDYRENFLHVLPLSVIESPIPAEEVRDAAIDHIQTLRFCSNEHVFRFDWSVDEYAKINMIENEKDAAKSYKRLQRMAQADILALSTAIREADVRAGKCLDGVEYGVRFPVPRMKCDALRRRGLRARQIGWRKDSEILEITIVVFAKSLRVQRWEFTFR